MYLPGKDKVVFADDQSVGARNDLRGMLLLDTALQTPVCRSEDQVKVEIPLAEVSLRKKKQFIKDIKNQYDYTAAVYRQILMKFILMLIQWITLNKSKMRKYLLRLLVCIQQQHGRD